MKLKAFIFLFFIPCVVVAHPYDDHEQNPALFHNVNVITGSVEFSVDDAIVRGAKPLKISRSYSSLRALSKQEIEIVTFLKNLRHGFLIEGGWSFFRHVYLLVYPGRWQEEEMTAYVADTLGGVIPYSFSCKNKNHDLILRPKQASCKMFGNVGAREDISNSFLQINDKQGQALLLLPDGTRRHYKGIPFTERKGSKTHNICYYVLEKEEFPSRYKHLYSYDRKDRLVGVKAVNNDESKTFASITFALSKPRTPYLFTAVTSDQKKIDYRFKDIKGLDYLSAIEGSGVIAQNFDYTKEKKKGSYLLSYIGVDNTTKYRFEYYPFLAKEDTQSSPYGGKVYKVLCPAGEGGSDVAIAQFVYEDGKTSVYDCNGVITEYHHDGKKLTAIEYFNSEKKSQGRTRFLWEDSRLIAKIREEASGLALFSKTFSYDSSGNIIKEIFWGDISGECSPPFLVGDSGSLDKAESVSREFTYDRDLHLMTCEKESGGLEYRYEYVIGTDLIKAKFTYCEERCLKREFFFYDSDHLLIEEIIDDGLGDHDSCLDGVTQRLIKRKDLDPSSGLPIRESLFGLDLQTKQELLISSKELLYNSMNLVEEEKVFDCSGLYRYSKYFRYDSMGHIIEEKSPHIASQSFSYDSAGMLISSKEIGRRQVINTYDSMKRLVRKQQVGDDDAETVEYCYDLKGNIIEEKNSFGLSTFQEYDSLGRCIKTLLPPFIDDQEQECRPSVTYHYDSYGNLTAAQNGDTAATTTAYNALHRPKSIIDCEGAKTIHTYYLTDTIKQTLHPDGAVESYSYDPFKRMTAKRVYNQERAMLSEELWEYDTFHLKLYKAPSGLTTTYHYDFAGRLAYTDTSGIKTYYHFDSLGFLEKKEEKESSYITKRDELGRTVEEWVEDASGRQELRKRYFFDEHNRRVKIERVTSAGLAQDLFTYDMQGRVLCHTTPLGDTFRYTYLVKSVNTSLQRLLTKTTVDPQGLLSEECFDGQGRLSFLCKYDEHNRPYYREDFRYSKAGHKALQTVTSYDLGAVSKQITLRWKYDNLGRIIQEIDSAGRATLFTYTNRGLVQHKTLSSGQIIYYSYDGLGRLIEIQDCQNTMHYRFHFGKDKNPYFFEDCLQGMNVERDYDLFGNIIEERAAERVTKWSYDKIGRLSQITLPDHSTIHYSFDGMHLKEVKRITKEGKHYCHSYVDFDLCGRPCYETLINEGKSKKTYYDIMERPISIKSSYHHCNYRYNNQGLVSYIDHSFAPARPLEYDCLHQLVQEGSDCYRFDPMGNPMDADIGEGNTLLFYKGAGLQYDCLGRPYVKSLKEDEVRYSFDILGRLTSIQKNNEPATIFCYDAVGRLHKREDLKETCFFLYDGDVEIGACDTLGTIKELKVLGYGLKEEVGSAIALELDGKVFLPLHDIKGSIIAIADPEGIVESYSMDSFGSCKKENSNLSPWRFQSKRHEGDLVFFGGRFYAPSLQRWLSPDPKGYIDGPNLYLFVLNNPANYLDLFGFEGEGFLSSSNVNLEVPMHLLQNNQIFDKAHALKGSIDGVAIDWIIKGGDWTRLQFSAQEIEAGKFNLLQHMHEILPKQERTVGLISFQNGIRTTRSEAAEFVSHIAGHVQKDTLVISLYNPQKNFFIELGESHAEITRSKETKMTALTRQYFTAISTTLFDINPRSLWLHIAHSRAGGIAARAIEGMSQEQQKILKQNLMYLGIAPSIPLPDNHAFSSKNIYSKDDYITGPLGRPWHGHKDYDIHFINCMTPFSERMKMIFFADHAFFGETYKSALSKEITNAIHTKRVSP